MKSLNGKMKNNIEVYLPSVALRYESPICATILVGRERHVGEVL